jgi:hypothetical protein
VCGAAPIAGAGAGLPGQILGTIVCWLVAMVSEERLAGNRVGRRVVEMKMLDKTEQSDRAANPNEKPENCYCSALPKGSGLCLPCYMRWLADRRVQSSPAPVISRNFVLKMIPVFAHACKLGLEGIVSQRLGSPYRREGSLQCGLGRRFSHSLANRAAGKGLKAGASTGLMRCAPGF